MTTEMKTAHTPGPWHIDPNDEYGFISEAQPVQTAFPEAVPSVKRDVFTLDEGDAVLQWPERISPESVEDLRSWFDLIIRKAERIASRLDDEYGTGTGSSE